MEGFLGKPQHAPSPGQRHFGSMRPFVKPVKRKGDSHGLDRGRKKTKKREMGADDEMDQVTIYSEDETSDLKTASQKYTSLVPVKAEHLAKVKEEEETGLTTAVKTEHLATAKEEEETGLKKAWCSDDEDEGEDMSGQVGFSDGEDDSSFMMFQPPELLQAQRDVARQACEIRIKLYPYKKLWEYLKSEANQQQQRNAAEKTRLEDLEAKVRELEGLVAADHLRVITVDISDDEDLDSDGDMPMQSGGERPETIEGQLERTRRELDEQRKLVEVLALDVAVKRCVKAPALERGRFEAAKEIIQGKKTGARQLPASFASGPSRALPAASPASATAPLHSNAVSSAPLSAARSSPASTRRDEAAPVALNTSQAHAGQRGTAPALQSTPAVHAARPLRETRATSMMEAAHALCQVSEDNTPGRTSWLAKPAAASVQKSSIPTTLSKAAVSGQVERTPLARRCTTTTFDSDDEDMLTQPADVLSKTARSNAVELTPVVRHTATITNDSGDDDMLTQPTDLFFEPAVAPDVSLPALTNDGMPMILMLPDDVLEVVLMYLNPGDVLELEKTCKRMREVLSHEFVYERAFRKVFGARPLQATPAPPLAGPGHGQGVARDKDSAQHVVVQAPVKTTFRKHFIAEKKTREYQEEGGIEDKEIRFYEITKPGQLVQRTYELMKFQGGKAKEEEVQQVLGDDMTVFQQRGGNPKPFLISSTSAESEDRKPRVDIRINVPIRVMDPDPLVDVGIQMLRCAEEMRPLEHAAVEVREKLREWPGLKVKTDLGSVSVSQVPAPMTIVKARIVKKSWKMLTIEQRMALAKMDVVTIPEDDMAIVSRVASSKPSRNKNKAVAKCQVGTVDAAPIWTDHNPARLSKRIGTESSQE